MSATLATMSVADGYVLNANRSKSMSTMVTAMKTAKTARSAITMIDWARSTSFEPTMLSAAIATTITDVKTLSQTPPASSPTKSDVA